MSSPLYREYAEYYDVIYREYLEKQVPRIAGFVEEVFRGDAERVVKRVLDLACGTGGPTLELAGRGYRVIGIDASSDMLRIARRKAAQLGLDAEFVEGDMRRLWFEEEFDAATCFFTSINYNLSDDDVLATLRGVYRSLRPGGVFLADTVNPLIRAPEMMKGVTQVWRVQRGNEVILVLDVKRLDESLMLEWERTILVAGPGGVRVIPDHHMLRLFTASELRLFAKLAGFRYVKVYGDYERRERADARRLILVAVK